MVVPFILSEKPPDDKKNEKKVYGFYEHSWPLRENNLSKTPAFYVTFFY